MFRRILLSTSRLGKFVTTSINVPSIQIKGNYSTIGKTLFAPQPTLIGCNKVSLLNNNNILDCFSCPVPFPVRTVTKYSLKSGKRKTSKAVVKRFYRLDWGGWIRPKVGRHKKIWKKSLALQRRLRQHVFCNATQSTLLDKMTTKFWQKPKYFVNDPYEPYHTREEFFTTRQKPRD